MTPVLLAGYCAAVAAVGVCKLAVASPRERVDVGATAVVVGIALTTACWAAVDASSSRAWPAALAGIGGVVAVGAGLWFVAGHYRDR